MSLRASITFVIVLLYSSLAYGQIVWKEIDTGLDVQLGGNQGIYFVNADTGWISGGDGTLLKTVDAGESWSPIDVGTDWVITNIQFFDEGVGYVLASTRNDLPHEEGGLLRTEDGGKTWNMVRHFPSERPRGAYFFNENIGWVTVGQSGVITKTTDGGDSFEDFELLVKPRLLSDIWFATPDTGWALGFSPILEKTVDGGRSWTLQPPLGNPEDVYGHVSGVGDRVWIGGATLRSDRTKFLYSWDRGETWTIDLIIGVPEVYVVAIYFLSEDEGYRLVSEGYVEGVPESMPTFYVEHTLDGGVTWEREEFPLGQLAAGALFVTDRHIWVTGGGGRRGFVYRGDRAGVVASGVDDVPSTIRLEQNYPNPFNPSTSITFHLDKPGRVELTVVDLLGRRVATLASGTLTAGNHARMWNPARSLPGGIYAYRLEADAVTLSRTLVYAK